MTILERVEELACSDIVGLIAATLLGLCYGCLVVALVAVIVTALRIIL